MAQKKWTQKRAKNEFFVGLKSSFPLFPPKRVKHVASTRKSRQQTGLKANWHYLRLEISSKDSLGRNPLDKRCSCKHWCCSNGACTTRLRNSPTSHRGLLGPQSEKSPRPKTKIGLLHMREMSEKN